MWKLKDTGTQISSAPSHPRSHSLICSPRVYWVPTTCQTYTKLWDGETEHVTDLISRNVPPRAGFFCEGPRRRRASLRRPHALSHSCSALSLCTRRHSLGFPDSSVINDQPSGRSSGGRNGNPLQYSCLDSPRGRKSRYVQTGVTVFWSFTDPKLWISRMLHMSEIFCFWCFSIT